MPKEAILFQQREEHFEFSDVNNFINNYFSIGVGECGVTTGRWGMVWLWGLSLISFKHHRHYQCGQAGNGVTKAIERALYLREMVIALIRASYCAERFSLIGKIS